MDCPACGTGGAYVGLNTIECISSACVHYAPSQGTLWNDPLIEKWKPVLSKMRVTTAVWGLVAKELEETYSKFPKDSPDAGKALVDKVQEINDSWGGGKP